VSAQRQAHFETYRDQSGDWRWRLRAANGRIVADSAEGYASRRNVHRALNDVPIHVAEAAERGSVEVAG
jgi:uncharacterized protein YegP (UPF0339 family)